MLATRKFDFDEKLIILAHVETRPVDKFATVTDEYVLMKLAKDFSIL